MTARLDAPLVLDQRQDGARVLFRHFLSPNAPREGWIREFSGDGALVRISRTSGSEDAGTWHRCFELKLEAVLEAAKAPAMKKASE